MTIRSDVVGSLLRPELLKEARRRWEAGQISAAELKQVEDRAVDEAVRLQEAAGLDVITDGEFRRYAFFGHLIDAVDGFDKMGGWAIPFRDEAGEELVFKRPVVVDKLRWRHSMCAEELVYLRARATRPVKVTLISTQQAAAYWDPEKSASAYPTRDGFLADVVDFTRREVEELVRLGATYIQIDAPQYAALLDPALREGYRQRGSDPDRLIDACIEMDNAVVGRHPGVTFGLHICRGNNQSMFYASGGYEPIARVFTQEPLPALPAGVRRRALRRLRAAASGAGRSRRGAGPGDEQEAPSGVGGRAAQAHRRGGAAHPARSTGAQPAVRLRLDHRRQPLSPEEQRRKLQRVAETAHVVWGA